jgi:DNA-binding NarL/FixJ family response regulator
MSERIPGVPSGSRLLLLEDNFLVGSALQAMLERLGCEVIGPLATLAEAWEVVEHERVDAGLLDINVIDGTSYAIAESLLQRGCPVIFITGYAQDELMPDSLRSISRLTKPIDPDMLDAALVEAFAAMTDGKGPEANGLHDHPPPPPA